jgi:CelD/BcsL family acetyltransferase involved in cellulose biosynthesis
LKLDEQVIASAIGFHQGPEYAYYLPAWNPVYERYAPSTLLLVHLMRYAWESGADTFDFMLGDEPYKAAWSTSQSRVHTVLAARPNAAGRLWLVERRTMHLMKERARASAHLKALRRHGLSALVRRIDRDR